jgi:magnesium transporter
MRILADSGAVRRVVFSTAEPAFRWIDVIAPDRPTLHSLTTELAIPASLTEDCLDPRALPKYERHGAVAFMILRAHVDPVPESAASSYELTQPLMIFTGPGFLVTLHRWDHRALARLRDEYEVSGPTLEFPAFSILEAVIQETMLTYQAPLDRLAADLERVEDSLLGPRLTERALEEVFVRKRRASALAWMLLRIREVLLRVHAPSDRGTPMVQALREDVEALHFRARELVEYTDNLMNLQIGIASHRTNEVMRVLTVMSVVFMPLTFIVGLYGMNFDAPEFHWRHGYLMVWVFLVAAFVGVLRWFNNRGWLR